VLCGENEVFQLFWLPSPELFTDVILKSFVENGKTKADSLLSTCCCGRVVVAFK
jgi:hypothetical protein